MLRDYKIRPGEMSEWLDEWAEKIYPLRLKFGFRVVGAWRMGDERFVWILRYDGKKGDFERANRRYYESHERKAIQPDPARHLADIKHWMMEGVPPGS